MSTQGSTLTSRNAKQNSRLKNVTIEGQIAEENYEIVDRRIDEYMRVCKARQREQYT